MHAIHLEMPGARGAPVLHQAELRGRAAHVEGEEGAEAEPRAEMDRRLDPRRRAAFHDLHGEPLRGLGCGGAAIGQHHEKRLFVAARGKTLLEPVEIGGGQPLHIGIDDRRGGALILLRLRMHGVGEGELDAWQFLGQDCGDALLMGRVRVGVQQADCNGLHALGAEDPGRVPHISLLERFEDAAVGQHAFPHAQAQMPGHQRRGVADEHVEQVVADLAPHLDDVAEAGGRDQPGARAAPGQDGVGDQRRRMDHAGGLGREAGPLRVKRGNAAEDRFLRRMRRSEDLGGQHATGAFHQHEVGEGAADIDAEPWACRHASAAATGVRGWKRASQGAGLPHPQGRCAMPAQATDSTGAGR
ncbi:MAG: hypothetical protein O9325_13970 [Roseomonas sp.]|nr:hypothetical protein [Roseomonas sp.]